MFRKFYPYIIVLFFVSVFFWVGSFSFRIPFFSDSVTYVDHMRASYSPYFSIGSNGKEVSQPIFSFFYPLFYKTITGERFSFSAKIPGNLENIQTVTLKTRFKPLVEQPLFIESKYKDAKNETRQYLYNNLQRNGVLKRTFAEVQDEENVYYHTFPSDFSDSAELFEYVRQKNREQSLQVYIDDSVLKDEFFTFDVPDRGFDFDLVVRGKHDFLTYTDGRDITISFDYIDINRKAGPDRFNLRILKDEEVVAYVQNPDDGDVATSGSGSLVATISASLTDPEPGIYTVQLDNSDDLITQNVSLSLPYFVATDNLFLARSDEYFDDVVAGDVIYTQGGSFSAKTFHESGVQTVDYGIGEAPLKLKEKREFDISFLDPEVRDGDLNLRTISFPQSNVKMELEENVYFSFTPESYLNFGKIEFLEEEDLKKSDLVVLTRDEILSESRGWYTSSVSFDYNDLLTTQDVVRFIFSGPENVNSHFLLDEVSIMYE